MITALVLL